MNAAADAAERRRAAAVAALAGALYLPSLTGPFQFDDWNAVAGDLTVRSWTALAGSLTKGARPLLRASYALGWTLGSGPFGFHLFNAGVHALNALLVYLVGRRLCARWGEARPGPALVAALLFACHPAQTEAVAYVCGRSVSLMASFYLGSVLLYLAGRRAWSVAAFAASAAVKETAVTLPAALLLVEWCGTRAFDGRSVFKRQAGHWALLLAGAPVFAFNARYRDLISYGFHERGALDNLRAQAGGVSYLLARLVTLRGLDIDPGLTPAAAWTPALAAQAALVAGLLLLGLVLTRRRPWAGFGLLWFFACLAPTNSFVPRLDLANDRQLYLACWGPFLALTVEAGRLRLARRALSVAAGALVAVFAAAALARQRDYRSEVALWEASVRENPDNARARNNLGHSYEEAGRRDEARAQYREALRLKPDYTKAGVNLRLLDWDDEARAQRGSNSGTTQRR